jgi:hypothetical protein
MTINNLTVTKKRSDFETEVRSLGLPNPEKYTCLTTLIVPNIGYPEREKLAYFPSQTDDLYAFLKENETESFVVDIYANDDSYIELTLHADWIYIADIIVRDIAAPLLIGLLIEYIVRRKRNKDDSNVKVKISVVSEKDREIVTMSYDGSANDFGQVMNTQMEKYKQNTEAVIPSRNKKKKKH